jgi:hypothetical protein
VDGIVCGWIYSIEKHLDEGTIEVFAALHESGYGPSRQAAFFGPTVPNGALRTSLPVFYFGGFK